MCSQENKEVISKIHDWSVHPISQNPNVLEPPKTSENVWLLCWQRKFLYASWIHVGRISLFSDEEKQKIWRATSNLENQRDMWRDKGNAR